jgi:hypothetical protein
MYSTKIFSKNFISNFQLLEDFSIQTKQIPGTQITLTPGTYPNTHQQQCTEKHEDGSLSYIWPNEASYKISIDGIKILPHKEVFLPAIRESLLGPVMGIAFHLNKSAVFHGASIVSKNNNGILLLGDSGMGKSTLSALALNKDARILSDDISVLSDELTHLEPSWPTIRLSSSLGNKLHLKECEEIVVTGREKKAYHLSDYQFCKDTVPLTTIYILARGENECESISSGDALKHLMDNIYTKALLDNKALQNYFNSCTSILKKHSVKILKSECGDKGIEWALNTILA